MSATTSNGEASRPIPQDGFRNGDLTRQDDEGYVYITGRKKDIIIMGGVNIASLVAVAKNASTKLGRDALAAVWQWQLRGA